MPCKESNPAFAPGRMFASSWSLVLLLLVAFSAVGCQRTDRLDRKVGASSPLEFTMWQARLADEFTAQEQQDIGDLLQEIRFEIMLGEASGSVAVDEALRSKIDGHTVREALQLGYELKLSRLESERAELEHMIQRNSGLTTRPGDTASAEYLANKLQEQTAHREKLAREILAMQEKFNRLLKLSESPHSLPPAMRDKTPGAIIAPPQDQKGIRADSPAVARP